MTPAESRSVLNTLVPFLDACEPIPLHWAVEHGESFAEAWASSEEPQLLLQIAASVVPQRTLVRAAVAVAHTVLVHVTDRTFGAALELIDDWGHLRSRMTDAKRRRVIRQIGEHWLSRQGYDDDGSDDAARATFAEHSVKAAIDTAEEGLSTGYLGQVASSVVLDALNAGAAAEELLMIIHAHIVPAPTLTDLVGLRQ